MSSLETTEALRLWVHEMFDFIKSAHENTRSYIHHLDTQSSGGLRERRNEFKVLSKQNQGLIYNSRQALGLLQSLLEAINDLKESGSTPTNEVFEDQVTDTAIREKWGFLQWKISQVSHTLAEAKPHIEPETDLLLGWMADVSSNFKEFLENCEVREFMYQACIWKMIHHYIFTGSPQLFGDPVRHHFKMLRSSLTDKLRNSESPSAALQWLADYPKAMEAYSSGHLDEFIALRADSACAVANISDGEEIAGVREAFQSIFSLAIELDTMCLGLKAHVKMDYPGHKKGTIFYETKVMRSVASVNEQTDNDRYAAFFVAPVLYKQGDCVGDNSSQEVILERATVVCY